MKIYTKTGDAGETGIIGKRVSKGSLLINSIGSLDELNASIGIILNKLNNLKIHAENSNSGNKDLLDQLNIYPGEAEELQKIKDILVEVQNALFDVGAILANGKSVRNFYLLILEIEKAIDLIDSKLPTLQNFILPGGSEITSFIHLARAICRRAERTLVELAQKDSGYTNLDESRADVLIFINRLSDYLFVLARFINLKLGYKDIIWKKSDLK